MDLDHGELQRWWAGVANALGMQLAVTSTTSLYEDLGWDSIDWLEVVAVLDEQGYTLDETKIPEVRTVGGLAKACRRANG